MTDQTVGWMDTSIPISAYPSGTSYQTITFLFPDGSTKTAGAFGLTASSILTNGDELILSNGMHGGGYYAQKNFTEVLPCVLINSIDVRARNSSGETTANLYINLLNADDDVIQSITFSVNSSIYAWFTTPTMMVSNVAGIQVACDNSVTVDYITFASWDYINQGGQALNLSIPKKTVSVTSPNTTDTIQQLGISSNAYAVTMPKAPVAAYNWLNEVMEEISPIELLTPTKQATGYVVDIKKHTEAGWVYTPLPTTDYLEVTAIPQQLYDISLTLNKTDNDINIDLTCPVVPVNPPNLVLPVSSGICTTDGDRAGDSFQRSGWYMAGLWWAFYTNDCDLEPLDQIGFWYRTTSDRISWSAPIQITTSARPTEQFNTGIWYDGTYLYYVACDGFGVSSQTTNIWFRRGVPNADGTITWSQPEQTILNPESGGTVFSFVVWVFTDVSGYPWIVYSRAGSNNSLKKNANTDGTWSTALTHSIASGGSLNTRLGGIPMLNGDVVAFWTDPTTEKHEFQLYNGSSWGSVITGSGADFDGVSFSAVATSNNQVHMTYVNSSSEGVYLIYDAPSNSIASETIMPGIAPTTDITIASDSEASYTDMFWGQGNYIYFMRRRVIDGMFSAVASENFGSAIGGRGMESWNDAGGYMFFWFSALPSDIYWAFFQAP